MPSNIATQDFESSGSLPGAPWAFDASWSIDVALNHTAGALNQSIKMTTGSSQAVQNTAQDTASGQVSVSTWFQFNAAVGSSSVAVRARSAAQNSANNCYVATYTGTTFLLQKRVAGVATSLGSSPLAITTLTPGQWYLIKIVCLGTQISARLYNGTNWMTGAGTFTSGTETDALVAIDSAFTGAGFFNVVGTISGTNQLNVDDINLDNISALTVGAQPTISLLKTNSVKLTGNAPTGGTGPYTYQWYRSTLAAFTPGGGNILSNGGGVTGATTLVLVDGSLSGTTPVFYKLVATDAAAATVTPLAVVVQPGTLPNSLQLAFFGDSIGVAPGAAGVGVIGADHFPGYEAEWLTSNGGFRSLTYINAHISGSDSSNGAAGWGTTATSSVAAAGNANLSGQGAVRYLDAFVVYATAAFGAPNRASNPVYAICNLGRNDALSSTAAATFLTQILAIVNSLLASGFYVVLDAPTHSELAASSWIDSKTDLVYAYQASIVTAQATCNTPAGAFVGDTAAPLCLGMNSAYTSDGTHPTSPGARILAENKGRRFLTIVNSAALSAGGGSGSGGGGRSLHIGL